MALVSNKGSIKQTLSNAIMKKKIMAGSGLLIIAFLFIHLLGNLSLFAGPGGINAYSQTLQSMPMVVWLFRFAIAIIFILHVGYAIQVTLENSTARPIAYARRNYQKSTFVSRSMIWTGLIIAIFIVYHLLHFTIQYLDPATSSAILRDSLGRPDVYRMVVLGMQNVLSIIVYLVGLAALSLHLSHGIHSALQTIGLATRSTLPVLNSMAFIIASIFFFAYTSIPASILATMVK